MENKPNILTLTNFTTESGAFYATLNLSYQVFGPALHTAPIVIVNHALTGNSQVIGATGWWNDLIGPAKTIDTQKYTVLAFNVPGNGFDGSVIESYLDFTARDVAQLFNLGLQQLEINSVYAIIGGSVGGGIAWEMAALSPQLAQHLIPIATDWKATDWLMANCYLQEQILNNSSRPIEDARIHAMLCYRTPESFEAKFNRTINSELGVFNIESWLAHHGEKLQQRFQLASYKLMNQLLKTIDITRGRGSFESVVAHITANIHIIGINTDLFFTPTENRKTNLELQQLQLQTSYQEINSIHGHDAFLIEFQQLHRLLATVFE
ncbi:MAG: alpha/beta fold hydrolase [Flavobacterium sp.]|nr:MAG: alpha/beta fold hydrolase [Flavobacterium sp.]